MKFGLASETGLQNKGGVLIHRGAKMGKRIVLNRDNMAPCKELHISFYFIGHKHQLVLFSRNDKNKKQ